MYAMIYSDGKIKVVVAMDLTYNECLKLKSQQEKPECYRIVQMNQ